MNVDAQNNDGNATASLPNSRRRYILTTLLKGVSRAFYLSIRVLPAGMREPVAVAYLLARAADTISDTPTLSHAQRLVRLREFRKVTQGQASTVGLSDLLAKIQPSAGERELLQTLPEVLSLLDSMVADDAKLVRSVVLTLTCGMRFDLTTFSRIDVETPVALNSTEQLDEYCNLVAGCVGEFFTDMAISHTPALAHWDAHEMRSLGVRFGKALQMTNILRDLPCDLRNGRCYIPKSALDSTGLTPVELLEPSHGLNARPAVIWGIRMTLDHFDAAERYIIAIPRRNLRLRLAALWPVLIGLQTLAALAECDNWLNPNTRVKVSRRAVYGTIALSLLCGRSNRLLRVWLRRIRARVERKIEA